MRILGENNPADKNFILQAQGEFSQIKSFWLV
jgi:hypothetical protein